MDVCEYLRCLCRSPLAEHRDTSEELMPLFSGLNTACTCTVQEFKSAGAGRGFHAVALRREGVLFVACCSKDGD